jgi:hypothetical protein
LFGGSVTETDAESSEGKGAANAVTPAVTEIDWTGILERRYGLDH